MFGVLGIVILDAEFVRPRATKLLVEKLDLVFLAVEQQWVVVAARKPGRVGRNFIAQHMFLGDGVTAQLKLDIDEVAPTFPHQPAVDRNRDADREGQ